MAQTSLEERMAKIEGAFEQVDRRLGRVEAELISLREEMNERFESLRREIQGGIGSVRREFHQEMGSLRGEVKALYRMTISVLIPMWVTIIGAIIGIALTR